MPERNHMYFAILATQAERPYRHSLDRSLWPAGIDLLANPKGVSRHEEDSGHNIADQGLSSETDGQAEYGCTSNERGRVDAELGKGD
jgi:hypothetical protein